jgi:hypothetical protein
MQRKWVAPPSPDWREDVDQSIGYALLETDHLPGFARRAPAFREKLAEAGWQVIRITEPVGQPDD